MRRAAKVDANQKEVVDALRKAGFDVRHTHQIGMGFPDVIVGVGGHNLLFEIKDGKKPPSAQKLTPFEADFHRDWPGHVSIVTSAEDAIEQALHFRQFGRARK